jgi:hypothetical protein
MLEAAGIQLSIWNKNEFICDFYQGAGDDEFSGRHMLKWIYWVGFLLKIDKP